VDAGIAKGSTQRDQHTEKAGRIGPLMRPDQVCGATPLVALRETCAPPVPLAPGPA